MNTSTPGNIAPAEPAGSGHGITNGLVRVFLRSNLSVALILLAAALGVGALLLTPREEDPQIVVPLADVTVDFPGRSAAEVARLVTTPLERMLFQIQGVEYVYSRSMPGRAVVTVRFYVGQDQERSLVKLRTKLDENLDVVPAGVTGWVVRPVAIDDVPVVTLTLASRTADDMTLRRVGEELAERLAGIRDVSRTYVVGGQPRVVQVYMDAPAMAAHGVSPLDLKRAIDGADVRAVAGDFRRGDQVVQVEAGGRFNASEQLRGLVVGMGNAGGPVHLRDVARVVDGPAEVDGYVRHGWGPARGFTKGDDFPGTVLGPGSPSTPTSQPTEPAERAVTVAVAKKAGSNAVGVASEVIARARDLQGTLVPSDVQVIVTRNAGLSANDKVNELVEGLGVAVFIVVGLLTLGLGWREALVVAVAVPVVFGLTLAVNLLLGFSINRVTLFALILSLGLLVDDPIVDVENIARHFAARRRATREVVVEAVAEIRPPLITATLAVILSFVPMFFITGMMGPYMRPMALNVPVAMVMSMVVAFTITPWMAFHVLGRRYNRGGPVPAGHDGDPNDLDAIKRSRLYRLFHPLMAPLLASRRRAWAFLLVMGGLTLVATGLAAVRRVPLKMLPFDNKNELLLVLDLDRGTTLERSDAAVRDLEAYVRGVPEIADYTAYVGVAAPMDFNGLVRQYYRRAGDNVAEVCLDLAGKKNRRQQSHAIALRMRNDLTAIATRHGARLKIVETPPGPPLIASVVAEVYGSPDSTYADVLAAARTVRGRLAAEPGVADLDDSADAPQRKAVFAVDQEKAALDGVTARQVADTLTAALGGTVVGTVDAAGERNPLQIELRLPVADRSNTADLGRLRVHGDGGHMVPLSELGRWTQATEDQTIYHKNLEPVAYVFAESAGRPPADVVVDVQADRGRAAEARRAVGSGWVADATPWPVAGRTFLWPGGGVGWDLPAGARVDFAGEGEWKITLDVFRDLGLAFAAAMVAIYVLLVAQTGSFALPLVVMMAIPLTVIGVMPGFWLLNAVAGHAGAATGGYADPTYFTATAMIGMIALAGIVTRDAIILVDFIHGAQARGRSLFDAIMESRVVRLRPILLTAGAAMLSAIPIIVDPIFSGLAWSLIFGLLASTAFTLFVIPVSYWLLYAGRDGMRPGRPSAGSDTGHIPGPTAVDTADAVSASHGR